MAALMIPRISLLISAKRIAALLLATIALAACEAAQAPNAPQAQFAGLTGEKFSTSDLRGKVVLINFWATSCASCVREMPRMVETWRKFAPRGYEMVAVAMSHDTPEKVADFTQRRALPFKVVLDQRGEVAQRFGEVRATPTSFLIDKQGRILKRYVGEPDWAELHRAVERALRS